MKTAAGDRRSGRSQSLALLAGCLVVASATALAQNGVRVVEVQQTGTPPTGLHGVVVEHDPGLATHSIYRPSDLKMDKHPVLVWGEGGCADNGLMFPEYLSEIASHGVVVIADGPPGALGAGAGGPNGPAARGAAPGGPRGGGQAPDGARAGGPRAGGGRAGGAGGGMVNGTDLVAAINWLEAQSKDRNSRFYDKVNVGRVAAMGMSCGGLMSYGASNDP